LGCERESEREKERRRTGVERDGERESVGGRCVNVVAMSVSLVRACRGKSGKGEGEVRECKGEFLH